MENTEKNTPRLRHIRALRVAVLGILLLLLYVLWGTLQYPLWWYGIFYEHGYKDVFNLLDGIIYVFRHYHITIIQTFIIVLSVIALQRTRVPRRLGSKFTHLWNHGIVSWVSLLIVIILVLLVAFSVSKLESRTREERETEREYKKVMQENRESLARLTQDLDANSKRIPLSVPTSFVYLDKESTDSLFGQYEPELVPAIMQEEIEQSTEISGGIHGNFISTDAGQKELNKRITEYRSVPKNSERKLKDLIRFLNEKNLLPMFRDIQPKSQELSRLDEATNLLSKKYELSADENKLKVVRDRLLVDELRFVENQLRDLRGLTIVEGEWSIENQVDAFILRRLFVENVSSSPVCEVKLRKNGINSQYKDVFENTRNKTLRLTVFGNVLVGLSGDSRTVSLNPTAIF